VRHDERGTIIVGWLTKVALLLTLVGILGFDVISVATTKMSAADNANNAAREGAQVYADTRGDVQEAYLAALDYAEEHGGTIEPDHFTVTDDGVVTVKITKTATTLVFYRNGATKKWAHVVAEASGKAV